MLLLLLTPPPTEIRVSRKIKFLNSFSRHRNSLFHQFIVLLMTLFFANNSFAQTRPPANLISGAPLKRGMYVSCGDELIKEIKGNINRYDSSGGSTTKCKELFDYATTNYFTYLAIYSLGKKFKVGNSDHTIIGDSTYWPALKVFLYVAHKKGIQIGMVVSNKDFIDPVTSLPNYSFSNSPFYYNFASTLSGCAYDTTEEFAFVQRNINTSYINPVVPSYTDPDSIGYSQIELAYYYPQFEKAELLKEILRLLKYSIDTKNEYYSSNGCADCSEEEFAERALPPLSSYLFDYISVEYEYWDDKTFNLFTADTLKTKQKKCWDNFIALTQMAFFAERMMCGHIKTELELMLQGPVYKANKTYPINQWDTAAGNVPWANEQAAFIGKYYNRIFLTDYRPSYGRNTMSMIRKVGAALRWLNDNPSSLASKNQILPLFSAATRDEKKHCFGDTLGKGAWDADYFGPFLSGSATPAHYHQNPYRTDTLSFFEWEFLFQNDSAQTYGYQCNFCNLFDTSSATTCAFNGVNDTIVGFMWYNYSTLNNTTTFAPHQYHRIANQTEGTMRQYYTNSINFSMEENILTIYQNQEPQLDSKLSIYSSDGKVVLTQYLNHSTESISLSFLPKGIYLTQLLSEEVNNIKRIIKIQ